MRAFKRFFGLPAPTPPAFPQTHFNHALTQAETALAMLGAGPLFGLAARRASDGAVKENEASISSPGWGSSLSRWLDRLQTTQMLSQYLERSIMLRATAFVVALFALSGCATMQPDLVKINSPFDEAAATAAMKPGSNRITGSAFLRQQGGAVVTCAGEAVTLFPATAYAIERMTAMYGEGKEGLRSVSQHRKGLLFDPEIPAYKTLAYDQRCDAQGRFTFARVADGDWYIVTAVVWSVGTYSAQGGTLMQRLTVKGGETRELVVTH
jgi:hypothetical protein